MESQMAAIWQKAAALLKDDMSPLMFNTFIEPIRPVSITEDTITFSVPVEFIRQQIDLRFMLYITNAVKLVTLKEYGIVIMTAKDLEKPSSDEPNAFDETQSIQLNPKYTFDSFVVGNSNRFAHAAAVAVAESPSKAYNPLFLYSDTGLGKTHLMNAISNHIKKQDPTKRVMYVSSEKFTNEVVDSIMKKTSDQFRNKYRSMDVLLIDDIQFIIGKERTQEEFFHTFNDLYESGKQIILSSDKPPKEMTTLEERLRSRFECGLITDLQKPDLETRIAILSKRVQQEQLNVPDDIIEFIANTVASNIRELEGALTRVIAYSLITKSEMTVDLAQEALKSIIESNKEKSVTSQVVIDAVCRYYDVKKDEVISEKRNRELIYPRQIIIYLCREELNIPFAKIGFEIGGRDHSTIMHSVAKIDKEIQTDAELKHSIDDIKKIIYGK
jgi:chromosomal replication initiator protein